MKLYAIAGAVLLTSFAVNAVLFKQWQSARDGARAEAIRAEQLDGQLDALHERIERAAEARRAGEQLIIEVRNAANDTEWGAYSVPVDVVRVLCDSANCARVSPPND